MYHVIYNNTFLHEPNSKKCGSYKLKPNNLPCPVSMFFVLFNAVSILSNLAAEKWKLGNFQTTIYIACVSQSCSWFERLGLASSDVSLSGGQLLRKQLEAYFQPCWKNLRCIESKINDALQLFENTNTLWAAIVFFGLFFRTVVYFVMSTVCSVHKRLKEVSIVS